MANGSWAIRAAWPGRHRFSLRRWPPELNLPPAELRTWLIDRDGRERCADFVQVHLR